MLRQNLIKPFDHYLRRDFHCTLVLHVHLPHMALRQIELPGKRSLCEIGSPLHNPYHIRSTQKNHSKDISLKKGDYHDELSCLLLNVKAVKHYINILIC